MNEPMPSIRNFGSAPRADRGRRGRCATRGARRAVVLAVAAALWCGIAVESAMATVVRALSFEAQCQTADRIFVGTVRAIATRPHAATTGLLETVVTFTVEETVTGSVPSELELHLAGGELDGKRQTIDGMPEFAVGERYIVMMEPDQEPPLVSPIIGFNQGLYRVEPDRSATGRLVVRSRSGRPLTLAAAATTARAAASEPDVETFLDAVRVARGLAP